MKRVLNALREIRWHLGLHIMTKADRRLVLQAIQLADVSMGGTNDEKA